MLRNTKDIENYVIGATDGEIGHVQGMLIDADNWTDAPVIPESGH